VGNLRSIKRGLEKSGAKVLITRNPKDLSQSDAIVFPGVGAFAEAVKNVVPISDVLLQAAENGKPFFGICLGLQLLFTRSSEGGSNNGLDLISGDIIKLPDSVKNPHMGWNTIDLVTSHPLLEGIQNHSYVYFVHTYVPQPSEHTAVVATTEYGVRFPSVIAEQNLFATQFHHEKSGKTGLTILKNFTKTVKR
jgi:glutamine amidotransferase